MASDQQSHLLKTKLQAPRLDEGRVVRSRLLESLGRSRDRCLTLICAPAGYGKSTIIAEWTAGVDRPVSWISLDESDNDLRGFLRYLTASVQSLYPDACEGTTALLKAANLPSVRELANGVVNELSSIDEEFSLVLDDYHEIRTPAIHELLVEVLRHPPANVSWIIGSRRDPPLPLASLRAGGQLHEIRFDDLRFSRSEVGELLERMLDETLSEAAVSRVDELTEGWAAGLQLVILACRKQADFDFFLRGLQGDIREIQDYLISEVLSGEVPEFRTCVLKTSIVPRIGADFCKKVCSGAESCPLAGESIVEKLADTGAFLTPIDLRGGWFRYHQLFRDLLLRQLESEVEKEEIEALKLRACHWLEDLGLIEEAIEQALDAGHPREAAEVLERHFLEELNEDRWQAVERWLKLIPLEIQQERSALLLGAACVAIERSQVAELPPLVQRMEALIEETPVGPELTGALNLLRGQIRYWEGQPKLAREYFERAREQIPSSQHLIAGENELHAALSLQAVGHYDEAKSELAASSRVNGNGAPIYHSRLVAGRVFVDMLAGELASAEDGARRLEGFGRKWEIGYVELWGTYMELLTRFHWADKEAMAERCFSLGGKIHLMHSRAAVDTLGILAMISEDLGRADEATVMEQRLCEFAAESDNLELRAVAESCRARLAIRRGDFEEAVRWQRSLNQPLDFASMLFWAENPWITECRVLLVGGSKVDLRLAGDKLSLLREGLAVLHNNCQLIEVEILTALTLHRQGNATDAFETLSRAIQLSEPGRWVRPFLELGDPMRKLLGQINAGKEAPEFVGHLLAQFESETAESEGPSNVRRRQAQNLIDPLTNRELDVLELIDQRLQDKEIAVRLSISPETVKSHLKHIYQKVDVGNRRGAVRRARELGIL